jgi:hypothetical protein
MAGDPLRDHAGCRQKAAVLARFIKGNNSIRAAPCFFLRVLAWH